MNEPGGLFVLDARLAMIGAVLITGTSCAHEAPYEPSDAGPPPVCGDGVLAEGEVCDDGNTVSGDGCEPDCQSACGDGVVQMPESCDDGNDVPTDGCAQCRSPGQLVWRAEAACAGSLSPGNGDTILNACVAGSFLLHRFSMTGDLIESWPRELVDDPLELIVQVHHVFEASNGSVTVALDVRRTESVSDSGNSRIRIVRFGADRRLLWSLDVTPFPTPGREYVRGMFVSADGMVAITGLSGGSSSSSNRALTALISNDGRLLWRHETPSITVGRSVWLDDDGVVYVGGSNDYDLGTFVEPMFMAISPAGDGVFRSVIDPLDFDTGGGGVVFGVTSSPDGSAVRIFGSVVTEDAVGDSTAVVWYRDSDEAGTTTPPTRLHVIDYRATPWEDAVDLLPHLGFADDDPDVPVYAWSHEEAFGIDGSDSNPWRILAMPEAGTFTARPFGHLVCFVETSTARKNLSCYLKQ